jgi:hypothetical protein
LADQSTSTKPDLHALTRSRLGGESVSVPRPASRWLLRFALPMLIVVIALALLAYAARDALMPTIEVDVVPVVARQIAVNDRAILDTPGQEREPTVIAQAPGWIEPEPFAVTVQAMIPAWSRMCWSLKATAWNEVRLSRGWLPMMPGTGASSRAVQIAGA